MCESKAGKNLMTEISDWIFKTTIHLLHITDKCVKVTQVKT